MEERERERERRFADGKRFATDDGKRDDSPWCPTKRRKERGGIVATSVSFLLLDFRRGNAFFLSLHSSTSGEQKVCMYICMYVERERRKEME